MERAKVPESSRTLGFELLAIPVGAILCLGNVLKTPLSHWPTAASTLKPNGQSSKSCHSAEGRVKPENSSGGSDVLRSLWEGM